MSIDCIRLNNMKMIEMLSQYSIVNVCFVMIKASDHNAELISLAVVT